MLTDTWVGRYWVDSEGKKDTSIKKEKDLPLESLTLNKESITLLRGETANLLTQWQPQDTTRWKYMQWTSSDPSVAEVSQRKNNSRGRRHCNHHSKYGNEGSNLHGDGDGQRGM